MPDVTPWIVSIAVAALSGGFARDVFDWLKSLGSGRGHRRSELEQAWERADDEARKRRLVEEHASELRRALISAECVTPDDIPPFPSYRKDKP